MNRVPLLRVLALVGALTLTACSSGSEPSASGEATPSPSASVSPVPGTMPSGGVTEPSGSPTEPPPFEPILGHLTFDATWLASLANPASGESWNEPRLWTGSEFDWYPEYEGYGGVYPTYFVEVGERDGYPIVVTVQPGDFGTGGGRIFEIRDGESWALPCADALESADCSESDFEFVNFGENFDYGTRYGSLAFPTTLDLYPEFTLSNSDSPWGDATALLHRVKPDEYGNATWLVRAQRLGEYVLADYGSAESRLIEVRSPTPITGVQGLEYYLEKPYGVHAKLTIESATYAGITWDDGWTPGTIENAYGASPAHFVLPVTGATCWGPAGRGAWSLETAHVDSQWYAAGTTPEGLRVYLPVEGGNPLAEEVFSFQAGIESNGGGTVGYQRSGTLDEGFLRSGRVSHDGGGPSQLTTLAEWYDARALIAVELPHGMWLLGIREDAAGFTVCGE